jgi:hypothetical protein
MVRAIPLLQAALAAAAMLVAVPSAGQVPQMMNYQVMLTDNADQPLADQGVTLVFRIYDDASAGALQWTETHNVTTNSIGVVSVILGETTPLPVTSFATPLWLEVQANGEILLPRRKLVSAPYAIHAEESNSGGAADGYSLDASDGSPVDAVYVNPSGDVGIGTTTPTWDVHVHRTSGNTYGHFTTATTGTGLSDGLVIGTEASGAGYLWNYENANLVFGTNQQTMVVLDAADAVRVGNSYSWSGKLDVYRLGVTTPEIVSTTDANGGQSTYYDEGASTTVLISADDNGTGGLIRVSKDASYSANEGFELNGNWSNTEQPALRVMGTDRGAYIYTSMSGNSSVSLPADAIGSTEMLNEPGVARNQHLTTVYLTGATDVITSRTITVPAAGYVLALGSCELGVAHVTGVVSRARVGLSSTTSLPVSQQCEQYVHLSIPSGYQTDVVSSHELFTVGSAATYTFYYLAEEIVGTWSVDKTVMTLVYIPTAYGTVALAGREGDDDAEGAPLTPADIAAEQAEARDFNLARVESELAEIRAEVEAMKVEPGTRALPANAPAPVQSEEPRGPTLATE